MTLCVRPRDIVVACVRDGALLRARACPLPLSFFDCLKMQIRVYVAVYCFLPVQLSRLLLFSYFATSFRD